MIHNAWSYASGDSNALRKRADELEKITQPSIEAYKSVSNLSESEIKMMMDQEEWITADEAYSYGFATEIVEEVAKQSVHDTMMSKVVYRCKSLEKENQELKQKINKEKPDAWTSFFNGGIK